MPMPHKLVRQRPAYSFNSEDETAVFKWTDVLKADEMLNELFRLLRSQIIH